LGYSSHRRIQYTQLQDILQVLQNIHTSGTSGYTYFRPVLQDIHTSGTSEYEYFRYFRIYILQVL